MLPINDGNWNYGPAPDGGRSSQLPHFSAPAITDSKLSVRRRQYSVFLYGGCGERMYKLRRDIGVYAADADGDSGDEWSDLRLYGSRISTGIVGASDRRVIIFGTQGGYLYLLNDKQTSEEVGDDSGYSGMGKEGKPVLGFPYRVVGGEVLTLTASGSGGGTRIMFVVGQPGQVKLYCFQLPP
ncbi:MAG: hypothetical protein QME74_10665 [Candidatus Edwardsbacteria bacterium]|nr:hypothetical protein [Candidatus Edwardsbacteria bacterium]